MPLSTSLLVCNSHVFDAASNVPTVIWDFEKRHCLHRDISTRNVLLQDVEGRLQGLLIDYDHAIESTRECLSAAGHRTVSATSPP